MVESGVLGGGDESREESFVRGAVGGKELEGVGASIAKAATATADAGAVKISSRIYVEQQLGWRRIPGLVVAAGRVMKRPSSGGSGDGRVPKRRTRLHSALDKFRWIRLR